MLRNAVFSQSANTQETSGTLVQANFLGGSSQRWDTVNMLYYCRLKQPTGSVLGLP